MPYRHATHMLLVLLMLLLGACGGPPSNDGYLVDPTYKPRGTPKAAEPPPPEPQKPGPVDVYLVPLDDFPLATAHAMAKRLAEELPLNIRVATTPLSVPKFKPFQYDQYDAIEMLKLMKPALEALPDRLDKTAYILYTRRDLNDKDSNTRFLFSKIWPDQRISVISTHRLYWDQRWVTPSADLATRLWKMSKRSIAENYYRLPRSTDINNLLYAPLLSAEDIDRIGTELRHTPQ